MVSILTLLDLTPSPSSFDFVTQQKQFHLDFLTTEHSHPKTTKLSQQIALDTEAGLRLIFSVDKDISDNIQDLVNDQARLATLTSSSKAISDAILNHRQVYYYGCGATGRLAKQMESTFWRPFWRSARTLAQSGLGQISLKSELGAFFEKFPKIEEQLVGEMTGADRALISSLEGFEDLPLVGQLQLRDRHIEPGT